ncbi:MAG TPA: cupin domain-containing protein [Edaphobacter sp.]
MHETIRIGEMNVTFITSRHETQDSLDCFEVTIPPLSSVIIPHIHRDHDETIIGIDGIVTWTVSGQQILVGPGDKLFIERGVPHFFGNLHDTVARYVCIQTPGLMGPEFFQEIAQHYHADAPPDLAAISAVMNRYGIIPIIHSRQLAGAKL